MSRWWVLHAPRFLRHKCVYDEPNGRGYVGFTAGICYKRGLHGGR